MKSLVIDGVVFSEDEKLTTLDQKVKVDRPVDKDEHQMTERELARKLIDRMNGRKTNGS